MTLDNAIVNIPLAKRGNIDNQLDRYKAEQATEAKQTAKTAAEAKREARAEAEQLAGYIPQIIEDTIAAAKAKGNKVSKPELRAMLVGMKFHEPTRFIKTVKGCKAYTEQN